MPKNDDYDPSEFGGNPMSHPMNPKPEYPAPRRDFTAVDAAIRLSKRDELFNDPRVWTAFYRDGKNLGEVAEMFGAGSIYELNPWLSAPMTTAFLQAVNRQGWIDIDRAAPPEDDTPCDVWHEGERKTDFIWSAARQRWEKVVGYPTKTVVLLGRVSHWRPVPGAPGSRT